MRGYRVIVEVNSVFTADTPDEAAELALAQVGGDGFQSVEVKGIWSVETGNWTDRWESA